MNGAGPDTHLPAALVRLRHATTRDVPACRLGVDRSTITRVIGEARPPLAERGCRVHHGARQRGNARRAVWRGAPDTVGTRGPGGRSVVRKRAPLPVPRRPRPSARPFWATFPAGGRSSATPGPS
ncbi:transposase family protein [Streptomyces sp. KL2]|uniref:transposase family protein n=1 Tax=Streptomyces sp. KL2 TaxID=3050126 RepID=UPI00397A44BA